MEGARAGLSPFACWETSGERVDHNAIAHCEILNVNDLHNHLLKHFGCRTLNTDSHYTSVTLYYLKGTLTKETNVYT